MNVLVINPILYTCEGWNIPQVKSIKDTMIYNMCKGFKALGHQVTLCAASEFMPSVEEDYEFDVVWCKSSCKAILPPPIPCSIELWSYLKRNRKRFDLVITSELFSFPSLFASLLCPRKTLIWHELALHQHKFHQLPSKIWYHVIAKMFQSKSLVVGRSVYARDFVRQYHRFTADECVEHGINVERFRVEQKKDDSFVVISQLIERKNIPSILRKFKKLIAWEAYQNYKLYIIGRGPLEQELKNMVAELNCFENVVFTGFMSHECMSEYVGKAKAMLIDTKQDNNMVSIPESIACGTPVVTNTIPTNSYLIAENGLGIVKDGWTDEDLIEIILHSEMYILHCVEYRAKLSSRYVAEKLIELYEKYCK